MKTEARTVRSKTTVSVAVPQALEAALHKNKLAATKFAALSLSCQREYRAWIADAKREETRNKRVATALEWVAEGKPRGGRQEGVMHAQHSRIN